MDVIDRTMFKVYVADKEKGVIYEWPSLKCVSYLGFKLTKMEQSEYPLSLSHGEVVDGIMIPGSSMGPTTVCSTARFTGNGISNGLLVMCASFYVSTSNIDRDSDTYDTWFLYDGISKETTRMFQGSNQGSVSDRYYAHQYDSWYKDVWSPRPDAFEWLLTVEGMAWYKIREYKYMK
jgi:hypothetical protein